MAVEQNFSPADCLALAEQSPAAVAAHDKQAWVGLFACYNIVEDPVGSVPHLSGVYDRREGRRGAGPLSRFYDTFIAPNSIRFQVDRDIVCGLHVVRDVSIEITMSPELVVSTPMHLRYELTEEEGELRIFRLAAHWEMAPMLKQQMGFGLESLKVGLVLGWRMVRNLGIGGIAGFMGALSSVGEPGKQRVARFEQYFNEQRGPQLTGLFDRGDLRVGFPYCGRNLPAAELAGEGGTLCFGKTIAAGNFVTASFNYQRDETSRDGVAFFEFDRRSLMIVGLSLYWQC